MIGYYIHHQGLGHRNRATQIARELTVPVTGFSSLERPKEWPGEWLQLPSDLAEHPVDPTAHGVLHWAPLVHPGYRERMGLMAEQLRSGMDLMVTDTSAEVTLLARLMGVPTVVMAMRGDRTDRTHRAAYDAATALIAPWSRQTSESYWPDEWTRKTTFTGAISRFDVPVRVPEASATAVPHERRHGRKTPSECRAPLNLGPTAGGDVRRKSVLVVWGRGGTEVGDTEIDAARSATPGWSWTVRSPDHPSPDLWRELHEADVVVSHGGNNAVAELSAAHARAVVVAQPRPHDEQAATAAALERAGICVGLQRWPDASAWPQLLARAQELGGPRWNAWRHGDGAYRAARAMEELMEANTP